MTKYRFSVISMEKQNFPWPKKVYQLTSNVKVVFSLITRESLSIPNNKSIILKFWDDCVNVRKKRPFFVTVVNDCCTTTMLPLIRHLLLATFVQKMIWQSFLDPRTYPIWSLSTFSNFPSSSPPSRGEDLTQLRR